MSDATAASAPANTYPSLPRILGAAELRVLGTLIEKSLTTPEQYPLSLNGTKVGCNQKTSREPVVNFDERTAGMALRELIDLKLAKEVYPPDRGAVKYEHRLGSCLDLRGPAVCVLATLMLRGAQTTGELRQNGHRLHAFETLGHLEDVLDRLSERELVFKLERMPGQREERYVHLLGERDAAMKQAAATAGRESSPEKRVMSGSSAEQVSNFSRPARESRRTGDTANESSSDIAELHAEINALKARVEALEAMFA